MVEKKKQKTLAEIKREIAYYHGILLGSNSLNDITHAKRCLLKLNEDLYKRKKKGVQIEIPLVKSGRVVALVMTVFLLCWSLPSWAASKTAQVYLVSVSGPNAVSHDQAGALFDIVRQSYADETGVTLQLYKHLRLGRYPFKSVFNIASSKGDLGRWEGFFRRRLTAKARKQVLFVAVVPPYYDTYSGQTGYWMLGWANGFCRLPPWAGVGYSTAEMKNLAGADRWWMSAEALKHEMGHLVGAFHDDSLPATCMHSNGLAYQPDAGPVLPFSVWSVGQVRKCVGLK